MPMTVEYAKQAIAEKHGFPFWDKMVVDISKNLPVGEYAHDSILLLNEVLELVDNELSRLSAELEKHRFIPVEEATPPMSAHVEVYYRDYGFAIALWDWESVENCPVTHWRYLPELP